MLKKNTRNEKTDTQLFILKVYQGVGVCVCVSELESYIHVCTRKNRFSFGSGVCETGFGKKMFKGWTGEVHEWDGILSDTNIFEKKKNNIFVSSKLKKFRTKLM